MVRTAGSPPRRARATIEFLTYSDDEVAELEARVRKAIDDGPYSFAVESVRVEVDG